MICAEINVSGVGAKHAPVAMSLSRSAARENARWARGSSNCGDSSRYKFPDHQPKLRACNCLCTTAGRRTWDDNEETLIIRSSQRQACHDMAWAKMQRPFLPLLCPAFTHPHSVCDVADSLLACMRRVVYYALRRARKRAVQCFRYLGDAIFAQDRQSRGKHLPCAAAIDSVRRRDHAVSVTPVRY